MLYKIAFCYFGNADDSEDAMQEVFIKLLYKSPSFNNDSHEKAWLIRTMQNTCLNMLKKSSRKQAEFDESIIFEKGVSNELHMDLMNAVIKLNSKYKSAIILYYYYDYSVAEIAQTLKISNSAVKMRLKRGRELLKSELEGYENE
ncbi:MAG: RNA polymerase sigma factor [Eubacterium sp.]|nr:RNA polymerase sigma factor [Eubacterium sp.]